MLPEAHPQDGSPVELTRSPTDSGARLTPGLLLEAAAFLWRQTEKLSLEQELGRLPPPAAAAEPLLAPFISARYVTGSRAANWLPPGKRRRRISVWRDLGNHKGARRATKYRAPVSRTGTRRRVHQTSRHLIALF